MSFLNFQAFILLAKVEFIIGHFADNRYFKFKNSITINIKIQ